MQPTLSLLSLVLLNYLNNVLRINLRKLLNFGYIQLHCFKSVHSLVLEPLSSLLVLDLAFLGLWQICPR